MGKPDETEKRRGHQSEPDQDAAPRTGGGARAGQAPAETQTITALKERGAVPVNTDARRAVMKPKKK